MFCLNSDTSQFAHAESYDALSETELLVFKKKKSLRLLACFLKR